MSVGSCQLSVCWRWREGERERGREGERERGREGEGEMEGWSLSGKRRVVSGQLSVDSFQTGRRGDGETGRWRDGEMSGEL